MKYVHLLLLEYYPGIQVKNSSVKLTEFGNSLQAQEYSYCSLGKIGIPLGSMIVAHPKICGSLC